MVLKCEKEIFLAFDFLAELVFENLKAYFSV